MSSFSLPDTYLPNKYTKPLYKSPTPPLDHATTTPQTRHKHLPNRSFPPYTLASPSAIALRISWASNAASFRHLASRSLTTPSSSASCSASSCAWVDAGAGAGSGSPSAAAGGGLAGGLRGGLRGGRGERTRFGDLSRAAGAGAGEGSRGRFVGRGGVAADGAARDGDGAEGEARMGSIALGARILERGVLGGDLVGGEFGRGGGLLVGWGQGWSGKKVTWCWGSRGWRELVWAG